MVMRAVRVVRFLLPFVVVLAIVGALVLVLTARPKLETSHDDVTHAWTTLEPSLDQRYTLLATANDAVRNTPGPVHQLVGDVDSALAQWRTLRQTNGSVGAKVQAANTLEAIGRRLVGAGQASARVQGDAKAKGAIDAYAAARPPTTAKAFNQAVAEYARQRSGGARPPLAALLGFDAILAYDGGPAGAAGSA
jgi:hypothetical protein